MYKSEKYAELLKYKRFDDAQGAYKELEQLLQLKPYTGLLRARKIHQSSIGESLAVSCFRDGKSYIFAYVSFAGLWCWKSFSVRSSNKNFQH